MRGNHSPVPHYIIPPPHHTTVCVLSIYLGEVTLMSGIKIKVLIHFLFLITAIFVVVTQRPRAEIYFILDLFNFII